MKEFGRSYGGHIERKETLSKIAPNFGDIYKDIPHCIARTQVNAKMLKIAQVECGWQQIIRQRVADAMVSWAVAMPMYRPPVLDVPRGATRFKKEGDAPHPSDPRMVGGLVSLEVPTVARDENGFPLNPMGRTGLAGRGILDKWGSTEAADPVVTRHHPQTGGLEVLIIQRNDTGEWAFPGGKVDAGETPAMAAGRELVEEAGVRGVDLDFSRASPVYAGYIDDSRNTDNAWMESTALHLHLNEEQASAIVIEAGSDADAARWVAIDQALQGTMIQAHADILSLTCGRRPQI